MYVVFFIIVCLFAINDNIMYAQTVNKLTVHCDTKGAEIPSTMYGHFFEDINFGADGGLYAELVKNRSFEFPQKTMGWNFFGNVSLCDDGPFENNPHYVRLGMTDHPHKYTGIENEGFFGIGLKSDSTYRFTVWARGEKQRIRVELINNSSTKDTQVIAVEKLSIHSKDWKKYELLLVPRETLPNAHLRIFLETNGPVDLEHISLFPIDTWKGREIGLRKDLVQALSETKPGVFRFPGGCIVEGTDLKTRYDWKKSIGPVENRPLNENRWHYTQLNRFFPDYYQTYGLGFYELFLLAEDIGAEPLPIVNCGLACQFQNTELKAHAEIDSLELYIQDALDLIEFANGDAHTIWGKKRIEMGHPSPFNLKYIGIGNEQWGEEYVVRLERFISEIRKKYPDIKIVGSAGPFPNGENFDILWAEMKRLKVDLVDEHFYRPEDWFLQSGTRYDLYDRNGPKVFAGEYACHGWKRGKNWNHFYASLLEAAFLTGVERNADIVHMATYAPLLAHVDGWQWRPDLIWFDNLRSVRTCSWYIQYLYGNNRGSNVVPITMSGKQVSGLSEQNGLFASAVWDNKTNAYIVKIVNTSFEKQNVSISFLGKKHSDFHSKVKRIIFHSDNIDDENTLDDPYKIMPVESDVMAEDCFNFDIDKATFVVYKYFLK